jgi:heme-degrading monooxygenase HmoA
MTEYATTPQPPYYAVIFTSKLTGKNPEYDQIAARMEELAKEQDGFLGIESAREDLGITVSYWRDLEAIKKWKTNSEHLIAQKKGRTGWYKYYKTRICLVERDYQFHEE